MFLDVLEQRDRIVDRRVIKAANDVARTQSGCGCGRVGFDVINDRSFRRQDLQLANTFSAPALRLRLIWFNFNRMNFAITLELDRNFFTLAPDNSPAYTVVHPEKPSHSLSVHFQNLVAWLQ